LYSRTLHTGGEAFGEISTKSSSKSLAILSASLVEYTPTSTLSPTNLTSNAVIFVLIL
jgi:hypothetical protein|tara:strand:+ start:967 stop:1140 length:174 start_codon:yes stop_codon:yes gene_type:complete